MQLFSGLIIVSYFIGNCIQILECDPWLLILAGFAQGAEFFVGCHDIVVAVFSSLLALAVSDCAGKIAGPVEVDAALDLMAIQLGKVRGVLLGHVRVAIEFANDGAIFTFNQAIVIAVSGS